jgi:molybdate transport system ATP-binding protein
MTRFELDIRVEQGHFVLSMAESFEARALALFGPSGSGKTTALEAIAGLRTPKPGRIAIAGQTLFDSRAGVNVPVRLRKVGYVPQDVLLFPHLRVGANVSYAAPQAPLDPEIIELLELRPLLGRRVDGLSGGERQRVALARALHARPSVLLLDEPLAAVDLAHRRRILDALISIRDTLRIPIVYVTHLPDEAEAIADRVLVMERGRVVDANAKFKMQNSK